MSGERHPRTAFSEQEIMNFSLDNIEVNPPTSMRGMLYWVENLGWVKATAGGEFPYEQMEYDASSNVIYRGMNTDIAAADGDTDWIVFKYEWSGGNMVKKRMRVTSWTSRATGW